MKSGYEDIEKSQYYLKTDRFEVEYAKVLVKYGTEKDGFVNYVKGANIAGFMKVAKAMMAQGIV